ncbi:MAG: hypothetical protein WD114_05060 [Phycisphaerales bacterium]
MPGMLDGLIVEHPSPSSFRNAFSWDIGQLLLYGSTHTVYTYPKESFSGDAFEVTVSESRYGWPLNAYLRSDAIDMETFSLANPSFSGSSPEYLSIDAIFGFRRDVGVRFDWRGLRLDLAPSSRAYPLLYAGLCENCGESHLTPEKTGFNRTLSQARVKQALRPRPPLPVLEYIPAPVPLWRGIIVNTLFWGCVFYAVSLLPRFMQIIKERSRIRRGLCVKCKYEVAGQPICPECGTAAPDHAARSC